MKQWYYVVNGQAVGPVSEEVFAELASRGEVTLETFVWNNDFGVANDWLPARNTKLAAFISGMIKEVRIEKKSFELPDWSPEEEAQFAPVITQGSIAATQNSRNRHANMLCLAPWTAEEEAEFQPMFTQSNVTTQASGAGERLFSSTRMNAA